MINKIIFLLFLGFIFISCGKEDSRVAIDMKITPLSGFEGLASFEVTAQEIDENGNATGKLYKTCKNYAQSKEVTFDLDKSGNYEFKFSGYIKADCSGERDWLGQSVTKININEINNVKIAVSKINSFVFSSADMHQGAAFMTSSVVGNEIILSGGTSSSRKTLKRIKDMQCDESSTNGEIPKCSDLESAGQLDDTWVCNTDSNGSVTSCYSTISSDECKAQWVNPGAIESQEIIDKCETCLKIINHKFESPESQCYIDRCLINNEGYGCTLKGRVFLQKIDINNLSSGFLRDKNDNILKLSETKILHDSVIADNDIYFVGGASEAMISNKAPFIFPKKTNVRTSIIDLYSKGVISNFSLNADFNNDILVDFNIFKTDKSFFVLNGRRDEFFTETSFFKKLIKCDTVLGECSFENVDSSELNPVIGAGIRDTVSSSGRYSSAVIGGISDSFNNYKIDLFEGSLTVRATPYTMSFGNLYKPTVIYDEHNKNVYVVGGLKYRKEAGNIIFEGVSNKIYAYDMTGNEIASYDIDSSFENTVFSQIVSYSYEGSNGILFVGGLKETNGKFDAIADVAFVSFDDILAGNSFIKLPSLNKSRFGHAVAIDESGRVWVMGGLANTIDADTGRVSGDFFVDKTIEIYTPETYTSKSEDTE